jgi:two-component system, NarL family, response regulator LiaR
MSAQTPIQIAIVDDHAMLRKGLAVFLMSYPDLQLVGEAANGKEALALCEAKHPSVVLMDLMMPIMDGITATRLIHDAFPAIKIIALTSFGEERLIKDILAAGAISYLFKKVSADDLAKAIRAAQRGIPTYAPEVTDILIQSLQKPKSQFEKLTPREREVMVLIVKGSSNHEIAESLMIELSTAKSHVSSILAKLGVASRSEVIAMVLEERFNLADYYVK